MSGDDRIGLDDLAHVRADALRRFAEVWCAARGEAVMPPRPALDPTAMPELLPHLWVCAFDPATGRFTYRLAGEAINRVYDRSLRGLDLADIIPPAGYPIVLRRYRNALDTPAAVHTEGRIYLHNERYHAGERLMLPLADDAGRAGFLIGATVVAGDWDYPETGDLAADHRTTVTPLRRVEGPGWREGFDGRAAR